VIWKLIVTAKRKMSLGKTMRKRINTAVKVDMGTKKVQAEIKYLRWKLKMVRVSWEKC
jgi:hypothetical protein